MKKKLTIFLIFFILFFPFFSFSQFQWEVDYPWEAPRPGYFSDYLLYLYRFVVWGSGMLAMFMIIIGGIYYMISGDSPDKKADSMDRIKMALIGLVLILGSYLILNTINPELRIIQLPQIRPAPDEKCIVFCKGLGGECDTRCQKIIENALAIWKKHTNDCPISEENKNNKKEDDPIEQIRNVLKDSCTLSCDALCVETCKKNFWKFQCNEFENEKAKKEALYGCKETKITTMYGKLPYKNCYKVCDKRKAPLKDCGPCCFRSIYTVENFFTPCSDASFEAYKKTCKVLWER